MGKAGELRKSEEKGWFRNIDHSMWLPQLYTVVGKYFSDLSNLNDLPSVYRAF